MTEHSILMNEQQYLSCLLNNPEFLKTEDVCYLTNDISKTIFTTIKKLHKESVSFNTTTILSECLKSNDDVSTEIIETLKSKISFVKDDFKHYKKRVIQDYVKDRVGTDILKNVSSHLLSKGELNIGVLRKTIDELNWAILTVSGKSNLKSFANIFDVYEKMLMERGSASNFMSTGLSFLDEQLVGNGIPKGQFITLFSTSGMGKTSTVLNMLNGNINKKIPLLYQPLEMGEILTMDKLLSLRTMIPLMEFYKTNNSGSVSDFVLEAVRKEKSKMIRNKFFKMSDTICTLNNVHENIKQMKNELGIDSVQVVIDLFTQLEEGRGDNKASVYQDLCDKFFDIMREENSTGIIVVQSKRKESFNVSNYEDCRKYAPKIEDIKNSGAFEERSRAILSVFRQKHVGIRTLGRDDPEVLLADDILELSILKQNLGNLSTLKFLYQGDCGKLYKINTEENVDN